MTLYKSYFSSIYPARKRQRHWDEYRIFAKWPDLHYGKIRILHCGIRELQFGIGELHHGIINAVSLNQDFAKSTDCLNENRRFSVAVMDACRLLFHQ